MQRHSKKPSRSSLMIGVGISGINFSPNSTRRVTASDRLGPRSRQNCTRIGVVAAKYSPQGDQIATATDYVWLIGKIYVAVLYMCKRVPHRGTPARIACRKWQARWRTRVSPARSCSTTSDVDEHSKCAGMYSLFFTIQLVPIEKVVYMMNSE
jgi:hypothetical protein